MINPNTPVENAQALADMRLAAARNLLKTQKANASSAKDALSKLQSALQTFQTALGKLPSSGAGASVVKYAASLSDAAIGAATVGAKAQPGSYTFFVEQIASAHQVSFNGLKPVAASDAGTLNVTLGDGTTFDVELSAANPDADGNVTPAALARAINQAEGNGGKVSASIVTVNGEQQLVMTSGQSGEAGRITLDTRQIGDADLQAALAQSKELSAARDAIFYLGGRDQGTRIVQASNTFAGIDGVSLTFKQAMRAGDAPVVLTVARDNGATADTLQQFVDAYNTLRKVLDDLTASGGNGAAAGSFSGDAGVRALQQRLDTMVRQSVDGARLAGYGVSADRYGKLSLDRATLDKMLAQDPAGLDAIFSGTGMSTGMGLSERMGNYLKTWLSGTDGQIKQRQDSVQSVQKSLKSRESSLDTQYSRVYEQYLAQFTRVQTLNTQMEQTLAILDSLPVFSGRK
jgi:flagellar hook-associated protein 2